MLQFHWLGEAYLFTWAIRLSIVPIALLSGALCGLAFVSYRLVRSHNFLVNALAGATLFTLTEVLLRLVFGGFYLGMLGYVAVGLPILGLSALGGEVLVSFFLVACSALAAEAFLSDRRILSFAQAGTFVLVAGAGAVLYQAPLAPAPGTPFSVAVIQTGIRAQASFARMEEGTLSFPELERQLAEAQALDPDLIIYPFSPVEGALLRTTEGLRPGALGVREDVFGSWLAAHASSTVMIWSVVYDGVYFNQYEYWKGGAVIGEYRKRALFPFLDYTPAWAKAVGLYTTVFDETSGGGGIVELGDVRLGGLLCSEVNRPYLAREDAKRVRLIIAAGSEAMFKNGLAGDFNLRAARFRAAENNVPVVRADLLGPSALIERDGSVLKVLPYERGGVLFGTFTLTEPVVTLYARWGDAPVWGMLVGIPVLAALIRRRYGAI